MRNYLEFGMRERVIGTNVEDALANIKAGRGAGPFDHLLAAYNEFEGNKDISPQELRRVTSSLRSNYGSCWKEQVYTPWRIAREINAVLGASQST